MRADAFELDGGEVAAGWVAPELREEFPGLALLGVAVDAQPRRSPQGVRDRLRVLSDRFRGGTAVQLRRTPIPHAYRVFFRHIGLDPDVHRPPVEELAVQRLLHGGLHSTNTVEDAATIALAETGVPVWALDAAAVRPPLGIRPAAEGERLGFEAEAPPVPAGRLVVADAGAPVALLFGEPAPDFAVGRRTRRILLFCVVVPGVPAIHVEEALATCLDVIADG